MVNIAFPYKENDASAMDMAPMVLQGMAEKGNKYIRACHALLTKIRATIRPQPMGSSSSALRPAYRSNDNTTDNHEPAQNLYQLHNNTSLSESSTLAANSVPGPNQTFSLEAESGPDLWQEVLGSIGIDMDRQWIESALMRE
ncbi:hypothetical protein BJX76DRAFT_360087 [Aspergillus varians]